MTRYLSNTIAKDETTQLVTVIDNGWEQGVVSSWK